MHVQTLLPMASVWSALWMSLDGQPGPGMLKPLCCQQSSPSTYPGVCVADSWKEMLPPTRQQGHGAQAPRHSLAQPVPTLGWVIRTKGPECRLGTVSFPAHPAKSPVEGSQTPRHPHVPVARPEPTAFSSMGMPSGLPWPPGPASPCQLPRAPGW